MNTSPEVDAWFETLDHPFKDAMPEVRSTILGVDGRIDEAIKWKRPTFMFDGNIATTDPRPRSMST